MIKTLIVDDDYNVLEGIANIINWEDYGFQITGKAQNGVDALEIIHENSLDVLITDITMPAMDGLSLIKEIKKMGKVVKTIILTCHREFEYAKEAIGLDVDDYIVKHTLTEDELVQIILRIKEKIEKERLDDERLYKATRELDVSRHVITEKLFTDIIEGNFATRHEIYNKAKDLKILLPTGDYRLVGFFIDNFNDAMKTCSIKEYSLLKFSITNILEEMMENEIYKEIFWTDKNVCILVYWEQTRMPDIKARMVDQIKLFIQNVKQYLNLSMSACFGDVFESIYELKEAIQDCEEMRKAYFYTGSGAIITQKREFEQEEIEKLYQLFQIEFQKHLLSDEGEQGLNNALENVCQRLEKEKYHPNSVKRLFRKMAADVEASANQIGITLNECHFNADTFDANKNHMTEFLKSYYHKTIAESQYTIREEIKKVLYYIQNHLKEDISRESMADYVNMNHSYFSRLFKQETGVNFSEYLIEKRIEYAIQLLKNTALSIEEISYEIGLKNPQHFYRTFKRLTGKTPGEFRIKR